MKIRCAFSLAAAAGMAVSSAAVAQFNMVTNIPGTFTDISGTGTVITTGDDSSVSFTSGVTNAAYPNANMFAATNGNITNIEFGAGQYTNTALPVATLGNALFPHWDDLYVDGPGSLKHQLVTEGGVPVEIIQWNQVRTFDGGAGSGTGTFEVKIFGGSGGPGGALVQFIYQNVAFVAGHENGSSATIGWQLSPTSYGQFSFNSATIQNGTVVSIVPLSNDPGACCLPNGTCSFVSQASCITAGGTFTSVGTTCANANCPPASRCCLPNQTCSLLTQAACAAQAGVFTANSTCATACPAISQVFALDVRLGRFLSFPVTSPANTSLGATAFTSFAMDFNAAGTTLYAVQYNTTAPGTLGTIDTATGAFTAIAPITGAAAGEANIGGLSLDPTTNIMYALGPAAAGVNTLYTINVATGNTTLVAPLSDPAALFIDIAIDNAGNMFAHDIVSDSIYSVNKTTGATTLLGPTGFAANFAQGMDFDPATNILYATIYTGGGVGSYVSINTTTGAATLIADTTSWNAEMEMAIRGATTAPVTCYPNCDHSTTVPFLNVLDFNCFLNAFSAGQTYANCDNSTTNPILNVLDFNCFLNKFSAGCSAP